MYGSRYEELMSRAIISSLPSCTGFVYLHYLFIFIMIATGMFGNCASEMCLHEEMKMIFIWLPFFPLFLSENSFGHRCSLCKLKVCTVWSEPILPTHYVRYSSACLLAWPRIICTMLSGSRFWHCPCLLPDLRDRASNILSSRIMCVIWFL